MRTSATLIGTLSITFLFLSTGVASADSILYTDQFRGVEVGAQVANPESETIDDFDSDEALDFGPFSASISATAFLDPIGATSAADHDSEFLADSITGTGAVSAFADSAPPGWTPSAYGDSFFEVTFEITEAAQYTLDGLLDAASTMAGEGYASLEFSGPAGTLFALDTDDGSAPISAAGPLDAGEYTLSVSVDATADSSGDSADASFDFALSVVPEPASIALLAIGMLMIAKRSS